MVSLGLILFVSNCILEVLSQGIVTDISQLPILVDSKCAYTPASVGTQYNEFTSSIIKDLQFSSTNGWSVEIYELCDPNTNVQPCISYNYHTEGVRNYGTHSCSFCPYHLDPFWNVHSPVTYSGTFLPMFGPCFDGQPPIQSVCIQHPALYPSNFTGVYHYPMQKPLGLDIWSNSIYGSASTTQPLHLFLSSTLTSWPKDSFNATVNPSQYGLGKTAVNQWLNAVYFTDKATGLKNQTLTNEFQQPYVTVAGVEQWIKWAQLFCSPACHKDARFTYVMVRQSDVDQDPKNYYLQSYVNGASQDNRMVRCTQCPQYAASYDWNIDSAAPYDPRANIFASQCYPWFGAIPKISASGPWMDMTFVTAASGIISPTEVVVVGSIPCPVNTFNRICAHTQEYYSQTGQYGCTPCPPGFHTAWKIGIYFFRHSQFSKANGTWPAGQWYCQPPLGQLFDQNYLLSQVSNVWGNRDLLNEAQGFKELECGYLPEHCVQCPLTNMPPGYHSLMFFLFVLCLE